MEGDKGRNIEYDKRRKVYRESTVYFLWKVYVIR